MKQSKMPELQEPATLSQLLADEFSSPRASPGILRKVTFLKNPRDKELGVLAGNEQ
jgi:hypothetical protein